MRTQLLFIIFIFSTQYVSSQNNNFSLDVNYPLVLGNYSYKTSNYSNPKGIVDVNIKYSMIKTNSSKIGIAYSLNFIKFDSGYSEFDPNNIKKYHHYYNHFNIFWEPMLVSSKKTHPFVSLGYTRLHSIKDKNTTDALKESNNGINFKFGIQYDLFNSFYAQSNFHFTRSKSETRWRDSNNLIKIGLGYRF